MQDPDPKCRHFGILWQFMAFWHFCQKVGQEIRSDFSDFIRFFSDFQTIPDFPTFRFHKSNAYPLVLVKKMDRLSRFCRTNVPLRRDAIWNLAETICLKLESRGGKMQKIQGSRGSKGLVYRVSGGQGVGLEGIRGPRGRSIGSRGVKGQAARVPGGQGVGLQGPRGSRGKFKAFHWINSDNCWIL